MISVAIGAPTARAQSAEAESLFDHAEALEHDGKLAEACDAFEASNRIEARAGTLIRLGDCRERLHQIASAWSAYKDALTRVKDPKKRDIATAKVEDLGPRLSYLTVNVHAPVAGLAITRNGRVIDAAEWNHPVPLDGGTYAIEARAAGHIAWQGSATVPDEHGQVPIDVPALAEEAHVVAVVTPTPEHPLPPTPESSSWTGQRKLAVAAAGVAVLAGIGGAILGQMANGKRGDADKLCPQQICETGADMATASQDLSIAHSRATGANIAFGVAGAAAIAAGVLWLTGAPDGSGATIAAAPGTAVITFRGRF